MRWRALLGVLTVTFTARPAVAQNACPLNDRVATADLGDFDTYADREIAVSNIGRAEGRPPKGLNGMEPTTAVRTDALPAIATVVGPGALASAPYVWLYLSGSPDRWSFAWEHEASALTVLVLFWIVAGFGIDSAGSYVEVYCIDRRRPDHQAMLDTWWRYLRIAWVHEPVGQHYLRRMLVSFKFELNMFVAAFLNIVSVGLLAALGSMQWPVAFGVEVGVGCARSLICERCAWEFRGTG